jgi:hypothetical protein
MMPINPPIKAYENNSIDLVMYCSIVICECSRARSGNCNGAVGFPNPQLSPVGAFVLRAFGSNAFLWREFSSGGDRRYGGRKEQTG